MTALDQSDQTVVRTLLDFTQNELEILLIYLEIFYSTKALKWH